MARRWASTVALVLLGAALPCGVAQAADDGLVLTRAELPGYKPGASGASVGRGALGSGRLPASLRKVPVTGASFSSGARRVSVGVFTLGSAKAASGALAQAGKGFKTVKGPGDGARERSRTTKRTTEAVVLVRSGTALGAVRVTLPGRQPQLASSAARGHAETLAARLRRVLSRDPWERTLAAVRPGGGVSPATALRTFAMALGPLPGVKVPPGKARITDGTIAMLRVNRVWDRLTPAQRVAIDTALGARHDPSQPPVARASETLAPDQVAQALAEKYEAIYRTKLPQIKAKIPIKAFRTDQSIKGANGTFAEAVAQPIDANGNWAGSNPMAYCRSWTRPTTRMSTSSRAARPTPSSGSGPPGLIA